MTPGRRLPHIDTARLMRQGGGGVHPAHHLGGLHSRRRRRLAARLRGAFRGRGRPARGWKRIRLRFLFFPALFLCQVPPYRIAFFHLACRGAAHTGDARLQGLRPLVHGRLCRFGLSGAGHRARAGRAGPARTADCAEPVYCRLRRRAVFCAARFALCSPAPAAALPARGGPCFGRGRNASGRGGDRVLCRSAARAALI